MRPEESVQRPRPYDDCRVGGCLGRNREPQLASSIDWLVLAIPIILLLAIMWYARRR